MKKIGLLGLVAVFAIAGATFRKSLDLAPTYGRSEEEIYETQRAYAESAYGPGTRSQIVSYGESGIGYVNHDLGIVFWHVDDVIEAVRGVAFDL